VAHGIARRCRRTCGDRRPENPAERHRGPLHPAARGGYYLFFSRDFCCQGLESTYNIAVGRSDSITGPYVDAEGKELLDGGGTAVLATDGGRVGPGGQSVSGGTLAFHYYATELDGAFRLGLADLEWKDGWPTVAED
jgi:arabinan endo-1,5-alpha-L-arabinosidase